MYEKVKSQKKKEKNSMTTLVTQVKEKKVKSKFNDEFEDYLKAQWYKKVLGLA